MIPTSYRAAAAHCVLPADNEVVAFAVSVDGRIERFALSAEDAYWLGRLLLDQVRTVNQSAMSSGSPSLEGSPHDGQKVYPPARSSSACCGVWYVPSISSSNQTSQPRLPGLMRNVPAATVHLKWLAMRAFVRCRELVAGYPKTSAAVARIAAADATDVSEAD